MADEVEVDFFWNFLLLWKLGFVLYGGGGGGCWRMLEDAGEWWLEDAGVGIFTTMCLFFALMDALSCGCIPGCGKGKWSR